MHYLSKHIFLCPGSNGVVLLDLKQDRYMALDARQAGLLVEFLQGWSIASEAKTTQANFSADEAVSLARSMSEKEILTTNMKLGKTATAPAVCPPARGIFEAASNNPPRISIRHIAALLVSAAFSAAALRWRSIQHVVNKVSRRRLLRGHSPAGFDLQATRNLVAIFYRLRPFVFRSNNACLFDSLTLINFLARFGVFPQWVFGVRTDPFAAHCWVQQDGTVFNDSVEHVVRYKPIMVV